MVREGLKAVAAGMSPMDLKRGMDKAVEAAVNGLRDLSRPCNDNREIAQAGTITTRRSCRSAWPSWPAVSQ